MYLFWFYWFVCWIPFVCFELCLTVIAVVGVWLVCFMLLCLDLIFKLLYVLLVLWWWFWLRLIVCCWCWPVAVGFGFVVGWFYLVCGLPVFLGYTFLADWCVGSLVLVIVWCCWVGVGLWLLFYVIFWLFCYRFYTGWCTGLLWIGRVNYLACCLLLLYLCCLCRMLWFCCLFLRFVWLFWVSLDCV